MLPKGYQLILDGTERIQPGDLMRVRDDEHSAYSSWHPADDLANTQVGLFAGWHSRKFQFCRPAKPTAEQPRAQTTDRGSKYHRTITQTLLGDTHGCSVTVDVYDVLRAWDVTCPAIQHAIKKLLQPGQRGSKSAAQDLREAIGSIERSIQLLADG